MNRLNFNQTGGFPLSTNILDAVQEAYSIFNQFGNLAGEKAIIVGCTELPGGQVTDGFVSINNELLPFRGSQKSANVIIVEKTDQRQFEDGSAKPVIHTRYATFGSSAISENYPWTNFRRPLTMFQLEDELNKVKKAVPIGLVAIWGKPADQIPAGWVEHTDLAGRVPVGYAEGDQDFGVLDGVTGVKSVTLDVSQMPKHGHDVTFNREKVGTGNPNSAGAQGGTGYTAKTTEVGGGEPHTNVQPSRIVKFIRFVGLN